MSSQSRAPSRRASPLDRELARIATDLGAAGERLASDGRDDLEGALAAVADARARLETLEHELVTLARRSGLSWAEIGAALNIIVPRDRDQLDSAELRYARRRRGGASKNGVPEPGTGIP